MKGNRGGRPPKPTALHIIQGTARPARMRKRKAEPQPAGELHEPPEWMGDDLKASWRYVITHSPPGLLKMIDRGALALWVEAENRHRIATMTQAAIDRGKTAPYLVKGPDGLLLVSPYVEIIDRAARVMLRCITELGFSPAARPRIRLDAPDTAADVMRSAKANPWKSELSLLPGGKLH